MPDSRCTSLIKNIWNTCLNALSIYHDVIAHVVRPFTQEGHVARLSLTCEDVDNVAKLIQRLSRGQTRCTMIST